MKYVPIFKARAGEITALMHLKDQTKEQITPLLQLLPDGLKKERVGDYVEEMVKKAAQAWRNRLVFLDAYYLKDLNLVTRFFENLQAAGLGIIPVLHLDSPSNYIDLVKGQYLQNNVLIRLKTEDLDVDTLRERLEGFIEKLGVEPSTIYLLFDFQYIKASSSIGHCRISFQSIKNQVLNFDEFKSIIVAAGSFPENLGDIKVGDIKELERHEWKLWQAVKAIYGNTVYADYGNSHAIISLENESYSGSSSIKYTSINEFVIFRGQKAADTKKGNEQYFEKCDQLVSRPCYSGPGFSYGDDRIWHIHIFKKDHGNPPIWVRYTQNHHMELIISLL